MEQSKTKTEEIKPKTSESQETKEEISLEKIDEALVIEEGILDSFNKFSKDEIFKEEDFYAKNESRFGLDNQDYNAYAKAGFWKKYENFTRLGFLKERHGLFQSPDRGLLDKSKADEGILGKETIEIKAENEEKITSRRYEIVDGEIVKIIKSRRTESGAVDAAGKLLNEKIESLEKGSGVELVKEKEGLEKHYSSTKKFDKMTEHLSEATKKELGEKIKQEGVEYQERIKEKEENLQAELDIFSTPFQERLDKTNELVDNFSGMLKDTKEAESNYNAKLKSINANIQEAQKSEFLEESKKELVKELELKKAEFEGKSKEFGVRKIEMEAKLGILKNNKTELEKTVNRINGIGKTKKEIAEEKNVKTGTAPKTEKNNSEPSGKEEKEKTDGKSGSVDFAEDGSFMAEKEEEVAEEEGEDYIKEAIGLQNFYDTSMPRQVEEIKMIVEKRLLGKGIDNFVKNYKVVKKQIIDNIFYVIKEKLKSNKKELVTVKDILRETDEHFKKIKMTYKP